MGILAEHVGCHDDDLENEYGWDENLGRHFVGEAPNHEDHGKSARIRDNVLLLPSGRCLLARETELV